METTLPLLARLEIPYGDIDVWTTDQQIADYRKVLPHQVNLRSVGVTPGLREARNAINKGYAPGVRIIQFDDDVREVKVGWRGVKLRPVSPQEWHRDVEWAFHVCHTLGMGLWGPYPVCNDYFMRDYATTDLRFIGGWCFGQIVHGDAAEQLVCDEKEDSERTLRAYVRDGGVLRLGWLAAQAGYLTGAGGMQDYRTDEREHAGARRVAELFPALARYAPSKGARGTPEVVLRRAPGLASPLPRPRWRTVENGFPPTS